MTLIFSKEQKVRDLVASSFKTINLDESETTKEKTLKLLELTSESSLTELTCIEELINFLGEDK